MEKQKLDAILNFNVGGIDSDEAHAAVDYVNESRKKNAQKRAR